MQETMNCPVLLISDFIAQYEPKDTSQQDAECGLNQIKHI